MWSQCRSCRKRRYTKRSGAKEAIRINHRGEGMREYRCPVADGWHIGHTPPAVLYGHTAASDLYSHQPQEHAVSNETRTAMEHIAKGWPLADVCAVSDLSENAVLALAVGNGYALDAASKRFRKAPQPKPKPQGIVRPQTDTGAVSASPVSNAGQALGSAAAPAPVSPIRPAHRDLIDEGKAHSSVKVQRAAVKAEVALGTLANLLDATREAEAAKRKAEAEKAAARAEVERLEKQLADAKAKLRGPARAAAVAVVAPNQAGASAKEIRAWAAANGIDCPANGRVPGAVVEAYAAAQVAA